MVGLQNSRLRTFSCLLVLLGAVLAKPLLGMPCAAPVECPMAAAPATSPCHHGEVQLSAACCCIAGPSAGKPTATTLRELPQTPAAGKPTHFPRRDLQSGSRPRPLHNPADNLRLDLLALHSSWLI